MLLFVRMRSVWPLTGRVEELAFIADASAPGDGSCGVVLAGAAGVGKTRLALETLALAAGRGMATRWVAATESSGSVPLGAFATLLGSVAGDPARILGAALTELVAGQNPPGVIVGVDDAHLLDPLSALLVHQLVLRDLATVVITVRTGAPAPDAVTAIWKDVGLKRLEVQPLSEDETRSLLAAVLGGSVDSYSVHRMWLLTRGNALFLRQLVDGEADAGRLRSEHGIWCWSGDPVISPELVELVEARMGQLSGSLPNVVDLLALGEPLDVDVISALTDPAVVEHGESLGLLCVDRQGQRLQVTLAHPMYGEVRRTRMGSLRARRLRGDIVMALGRSPELPAADVMRRAVLAVESDLAPDPELLVTAARSASHLVDLSLAERLARAAAESGGGFESLMMLAYAVSFQGRGGEAEQILARLAGLAGNDHERSVIATTRVANLLWVMGDPETAAQVLAAAERIVRDEHCRLVLLAIRSALDMGVGRARQAVDAAVHTLASEDLPALAVMLATYGMVAGLGVLGNGDTLSTAAARGYAETERSVDVAFLKFGLVFMHLGGLRLAGHLREADDVAAQRSNLGSDLPGPARLYGSAFLGQTALAHGRAAEALPFLREADAGIGDDSQGFGFVSLLNLTEALAVAGLTTEADQACGRLEADRHPAFAYLEPEVLLARAWVFAADGGVQHAVSIAHQAATEARRLGQPAHEVMALQTAARFGDRTVADRLIQLATTVDGPRATAAAGHAAALANNDGEALTVASRQLEAMGDLLAAADAAAQASVSFTHHGRTGSATVAAARALHLVRACGGARTPATQAAARPLPLTRREREIVTLAAGGLSNRAISDKLLVSVRTVEGHLYNASAKLGTADRSEFGAVLAGD